MYKGKIIKCVETGVYYPSYIMAAREMFGLKTPGAITKAVENNTPYKGYHFVGIEAKDKDAKLQKNESICWICQNTHKEFCSWFNPDVIEPVDGWTAKKVTLQIDEHRKSVGYIVKKCPNFLKEEWYKWEV